MRFRFKNKKLRALYKDRAGSEKFPAETVEAFFIVMSSICAAADERDLRVLKSLHFEKLLGGRKDQHSFRLNKKWRLVISLQSDAKGKYLSIEEIGNHYKG